MSLYPSSPDIFVNRTGANAIASSDPNNAYDAIEAIEGFVGSSGVTQANSKDLLDWISQQLPGIRLSYSDADTLVASAGVVFGLDAGEAIRTPRRNASATDVETASMMDTGTIATTTPYYVHADFDATATTVVFKISLSATAPTGITTFQLLGGFSTDASANIIENTVWSMIGMRVVDVKTVVDGDLQEFSGATTVIPVDNSIPQISEGKQVMSLTVPMLTGTKKVRIDVWVNLSMANTDQDVCALFDGSTPAIGASIIGYDSTSTAAFHAFTVWQDIATVADKTYTARIGGGTAGTLNFNGRGSARQMGGVSPSFISVTQYANS